MAYANPSTFVAGNVLTAAQQNVLANNDRFFHGPPTVRVRATTNSTLANAAFTSIDFNTEDWDNDGMFSSTSNRKLICRTAGKYQVNFSMGFSASSAGSQRIVCIQKNTTTAGGAHEVRHGVHSTALAGVAYNLSCSQLIALSTGQFIRAEAFQDSGAGLQWSTNVENQPRLSAFWVSS